MAQQIQDLKDQVNSLKAEKGFGVAVSLQLVRQLASSPLRLRDPFAILAALQKLADEARTSGDVAAPRYEAIVRQVRPLASSPQFGHIIIRLLGSKDECEAAAAIAKMSKSRAPVSFHPYARSTPPQRPVSLRGFPSRGLRRGSRSSRGRGVCFSRGDPGHFLSFLLTVVFFFAIKHGPLIIFLVVVFFASSCVPVL